MMLTISTGEAQRPLKMRHDSDRRAQPDRRRSSVEMRVRVGLWYQYHRATRAGEFDPFPRNPYSRAKLQEALLPEAAKYRFAARETGVAVAPSGALAAALDYLWANPRVGCNAAGESIAAYAVNAIAEYLVRSFHVSTLDRRQAERRSPAK